jgi:16S rRNA (adenine1518-N6/adenine1519-N6)-dimethyltransferase
MATQIELLKKHGLSVRGNMGQHLLIDPNIQKKIVDLLDLKAGETVLEIGPGLGALTGEMIRRGAKVIAVEKDARFVAILREEYDPKALEVIEDDIIHFDFKKISERTGKKKIKVISNLPYYITAPILFRLADEKDMIAGAVLMMQKEVADRVMASPGSKDYGRLTLAVRYSAEVRHAFDVSRGCFTPQPEVSSSVLVFDFYPGKQLLEKETETRVFKLIELAFSQRRKTFLGIMSHDPKTGKKREELEKIFTKLGLKLTARGEELLFKDYLALEKELK